MDLELLTSAAAFVAVVLSIISFFSSRKKDQSDLDKNQDMEIIKLKERMIALGERVSKVEGAQDVFDGKMSKELDKVYNKISEMETHVRDGLQNIVGLLANSK